MSAEAERNPALADAAEQIAAELNQVLVDSYGAGSRHTQIEIGPDLIVAVMDVELSRAEETLLDSGQGEAVRQLRSSYQEAIAPTFKAIVERATGREVASFLSSTSIDPLFSVELFRLKPARSSQETPDGSR
jgi:uncharacterized protein YbcI